MAALSTLLRSSTQHLKSSVRLLAPKCSLNNVIVQQIPKREMSHGFAIQPTRWQWHKTKDMLHFYFMVGAIPWGLIVFFSNIFVGPATLTPTPEGYVPEHWEYHRHPITRFLARYIYGSPQKDYEKNCFALWEADQIRKIRALERMVDCRMEKRQDYRYGYFVPYETFQLREKREVIKYMKDGIHES